MGIIPIVKPTRCTSVSNLFYFDVTLYMFRTVFPSVTRSSRLYIEQQEFVKQILLPACRNRYCCLLALQAGSSICLTYACCCIYSLELLAMDGKTVRNMQSVILK